MADEFTLASATIDELVAEIKSRCDTVVVLLRPSTPEGYAWAHYFKGSTPQMMFDMELAKYNMFNDANDTEENQEADG